MAQPDDMPMQPSKMAHTAAPTAAQTNAVSHADCAAAVQHVGEELAAALNLAPRARYCDKFDNCLQLHTTAGTEAAAVDAPRPTFALASERVFLLSAGTANAPPRHTDQIPRQRQGASRYSGETNLQL
eukprot:TRINITY_DN14506_c0_g1_i4.p2 TRINITY_DN14506_c0_g1~~TRINITY_DN14506_c0_g1_i4.p2  ORF type:complete len:128 (+),score=15.61 TRINITY_DN14506_c0_g1_i4:135-518(+)